MAVPDARVELQIAGVWTDITSAVRKTDSIRHARGRRSEGSGVDPSSTSLTLNDPDGIYNNRNPRSPYYGQLGRNVPLRYSVGGANVGLVLLSAETSRAVTPDVAALDVTGDIDVRADLTPAYWAGARGEFAWEVMGKAGGGTASWWVDIADNGTIAFQWSTTGANSFLASSTLPVPFAPGQRGAIRATLDVDNGASGRTVTFYTSDTISGTWTQLGSPVIQAGATSIFAGTADLRAGDYSTSSTWGTPRIIHAIEVRNGIAGTIVANPSFVSQTSGTSSFSDSAGRSWTLSGAAAITSRRTRTVSEISEWAPRWHVSGNDVRAPIQAAGIMRRLSQGRRPLRSALTRGLPTLGPVAYWPMEDGSDSRQAWSPIAGVAPLTVSGLSMASDSSLPASDALPTIRAGATLRGLVPPHTPANSALRFFYKVSSAPSASGTLLEWTSTGSPWRIWRVRFTATDFQLIVEDGAGATTSVVAANMTSAHGAGWRQCLIYLLPSGADLDVVTSWGFATLTNTTMGRITSFDTAFGSSLDGVGIGHIAIYNDDPPEATSFDAAWSGELAGDRVVRLTTEETVPADVWGSTLDQQALGYQRPDQLMDLLGECEAADGGILLEDRTRLGLVYRGRTTLYSQPPALTIPYGHLAELGPPRDDDTRIRNDRTVKRSFGSQGRWVQPDGPLAPNAVGLYDDEQTLNLATDAQCEPIAQWLVHLGTVDEARYPQVRLMLHKYPQYINAATSLDIGSVIRVTGLPDHLPPGPLDLLVEGYEETLGPLSWDLVLTCSPAAPWQIGIVDDLAYGRADTDGSTLGADTTSTATTLVVNTTQTDTGTVPLWTQDPADYPMDLRVGGEVVTASAATSLAADDFGRTVAAGSWGTASDGLHTYTLTGGVSSSERSVASGRGIVTVTTSQTLLRAQTIAETCADCEVRVQVAVSAMAAGGSLVPSVLLRWVSTTSCYRARVEFTTGGTVSLSVAVGSTIIDTSAATGLTYTPGATFEVRVRLIGDRVLMRIWPTGTTEPILWHIDRTAVTGTVASGAIGLGAGAFSGNSNASVEYRFDNFTVESPQRITVTRSTNGIVKPHAAGAAVNLAQPSTAAL